MKTLTATAPLLPLALALAGCEPSYLADYRDAELAIVEAGPSEYLLKLHPAAYRPPCRPALWEELRATFNGTAVAPAPPEPPYTVGDREFCSDPHFVVPDVGPGDVEIVLDDGREQFRMKVHSAFASRTWVREPVDSTTLAVAEQVTLKWLPATDVVSSDPAEVSLIDGGGQYVWGAASVRVDATTFQFTVPATATPGTGTLTIGVSASPAITECSGPAACSGPSLYAATRQVTVQ